jgi:hypothetical protein
VGKYDSFSHYCQQKKEINMNKKPKQIEIKPNTKLDGKVFCCSEVFTLDKKGNILKKE